MDKPWKNDNCANMKAQYAVFSIPKAGLLWCGVPEDKIDEFLPNIYQLSMTGFGRGVWLHDDVDCLGARTRAMAEAIDAKELPHGREDAQTVPEEEYVAYERRHIFGKDLRKWIEKEFPNEKPAFLFDDIEQSSHTSINADSFRALQADRDALKTRIDNAEVAYKKLRKENNQIEKERDSLKLNAEKQLKLLTSKERNSLLILIGALCKDAGIDYNERGIASALEKMTEILGAPITDDTIRNILKQIDDAVSLRSK